MKQFSLYAYLLCASWMCAMQMSYSHKEQLGVLYGLDTQVNNRSFQRLRDSSCLNSSDANKASIDLIGYCNENLTTLMVDTIDERELANWYRCYQALSFIVGYRALWLDLQHRKELNDILSGVIKHFNWLESVRPQYQQIFDRLANNVRCDGM